MGWISDRKHKTGHGLNSSPQNNGSDMADIKLVDQVERQGCRGNETGFHTCGLPIGGCGSQRSESPAPHEFKANIDADHTEFCEHIANNKFCAQPRSALVHAEAPEPERTNRMYVRRGNENGYIDMVTMEFIAEGASDPPEDRDYRWTITPHPYDKGYDVLVTNDDYNAREALLSLWDSAEGETSFKTEFDGSVPAVRSHVLITKKTCPCDKRSDTPCNVCDSGLAICSVCGKAEAELDGPCVRVPAAQADKHQFEPHDDDDNDSNFCRLCNKYRLDERYHVAAAQGDVGAEICAEMARESAMQAARCLSAWQEDGFEHDSDAAKKYADRADALREAECRIRALHYSTRRGK